MADIEVYRNDNGLYRQFMSETTVYSQFITNNTEPNEEARYLLYKT